VVGEDGLARRRPAEPSVLHVQARGTAAASQWLAGLCHSRRLSPTQRRIAQSYIDTMPAAAFLSTSEAAQRAGMSQASITRLPATLGFAAYADLRNALREVLLGGTADEAEADTQAQGTDPVAQAQHSLDALRNTLGSSARSSAVAEMAEARTLAIVGFRASASLAACTGFFASRILDAVRVLTNPDTALDGLAHL
jgi:DNA-binding MurR/RpiR family transcriptional regulator